MAEQLMLQQTMLMKAIDYSLVYALHSFVANLEGQVCVLKGDPLALLDDSNSYWWLVRCCKTEEVGYIPAENIETPYERLARLNRIRNVQLALLASADIHNVITSQRNSKTVKKSIGFAEEPLIFYAANLGEDYDAFEVEDEDGIDQEEYESRVAQIREKNSHLVSRLDNPADADKQRKSGSFWSKFAGRRDRTNSVDAGVIRARSASRQHQRVGSVFETEIKRRTSVESLLKVSHHVSMTMIPQTSSSGSALDSPVATDAIRVLRIYSGNVDLNATFKTVVWNEETTVETLLAATLKRFKVANASSGEYYLSVLHFDSQEKRLPAHEKVQRLLESLSSAKLPGLSTSKKVTKVLAGNVNSIIINDDQIIKILVNRNAHMSFTSHLRLVRVFMYDEADPTGVARTSKTLSVAEAMRVSELAALAGRKFKIGEALLAEYWLLTRHKGRGASFFCLLLQAEVALLLCS
ncbi:hypothetical protein BC830DRAFT_810494 [Chytriomyces sp. MP71]|nr:hypothetical protein BC830DRAFT_810494 [Chytriomyces sp. MP71]